MCCYRKGKRRLNSNSNTLCNTPTNSMIQKPDATTPGQASQQQSSQQQQQGSGGENNNINNVAAAGKTPDQRIQPIAATNPQPIPPPPPSSTPKTQTPKGTSKERTERTTPGTAEDTKSKMQSTRSHIPAVPVRMPQPRTPLKVEKKCVVVHKGSLGSLKSQKRKGTQSKRPDGKPEESEHFEEGDDKSKEEVSVDDTLKGVGTQMPHFES